MNEKMINELWGTDRRGYQEILDNHNICGRDRIEIKEYLEQGTPQDYDEFEKELEYILKY